MILTQTDKEKLQEVKVKKPKILKGFCAKTSAYCTEWFCAINTSSKGTEPKCWKIDNC